MKTVKRWTSLLLAVLLLATLLTGCKKPVNVDGGAAAQDYPVQVLGIELSSKPSKVVVISQSLADVALALGCESQVAGVTADCTQPQYTETPKVDVNSAESITVLEPDVVLADAVTPEDVRTRLQEAGLKVAYVTAPSNRGDFERMYSEVGTVFSGASTGYTHGSEVATDICHTLDDIERIVPDSNGVVTTAAILFDLNGKGVVGDMFLDSVMDAAGLDNVFAGQKGAYDPTMLRAVNPDYIFCTETVAEILKKDYTMLNAVAKNRVTVITEEQYVRMGRTVVTLATLMAGAAYPELLEEPSQEPTISVTQPKYEALLPGDESEQVREMQARLFELGFLTVSTYDGYYGEATKEAVMAFQEKNDLYGDGIAREATLRLLFSEDAKGADDR